jgi:adenylate cyclase
VPFYVSSCWVALVPAVVAAVVSYIAVLLYRYVFIERESRQVAMALSQYTSATLAREMAEDPALCRRAEKREVTAMFTDLRGFTPISERIGAERTQHVLNLCLGRCAEVMLRYEAMINKFIGDGIFAFWNPLIFPQPDHALRACETALDLQVALRELADEQRRAGGDEVFGELVLRVGVATGTAVVGPCGSEQKYDYTCIGDTVNLAARLESANKFYGTLILAGGATHEQVGARFVFRPLGGVQVKGKRQAVPIYELLGRAGETSEPQRAYAEEFGRAIDLFHRRQWDQARAMFDACRSQRSDDLAAQRYLEALALFATQPPADDWGGALELSEK